MNDFEKIRIWFLKIRQKIIYKSTETIKEFFIKKISDNSLQVICFGGFDERVCVIYSENRFSVLICSIDKKLKDTAFYKKYSQELNFSNINHSVVIVLLNGLLRLVEVYSQGKLLNLQMHWKVKTACLL